jgi:hypothetical protein
MNNKIEPHYVDFNTAKLLKEKGFNEECSFIYSAMEGQENELLPVNSSINHIIEFNKKGLKFFDDSRGDKTRINQTIKNSYAKKTITAPEQHIVIEWLRVNHDIWVCINPKREIINNTNEMWYDAEVWKLETDEIKLYGWKELAAPSKTPQEAYSKAFDYVLKQLI